MQSLAMQSLQHAGAAENETLAVHGEGAQASFQGAAACAAIRSFMQGAAAVRFRRHKLMTQTRLALIPAV